MLQPLKDSIEFIKKRKFGYIVRETSVFERAKNAFSDRNESENFKRQACIHENPL